MRDIYMGLACMTQDLKGTIVLPFFWNSNWTPHRMCKDVSNSTKHLFRQLNPALYFMVLFKSNVISFSCTKLVTLPASTTEQTLFHLLEEITCTTLFLKGMDLSGNPCLNFGSDSGHEGTWVLVSRFNKRGKNPGSVPNKPPMKLRAMKYRYYTQF